MSGEKNSYQKLYDAVNITYKEKGGSFVQTETNRIWDKIKLECGTNEERDNIANQEIRKLQELATKKKAKSITDFFQVS